MGSYNYNNYDFTMPNFNSFNQGLSLQSSYGNFGSIWESSPWNNYDFSSGLSLQGSYRNFGSIWGNPFGNDFYSNMPKLMSFDEFYTASQKDEPKEEAKPATNTNTNSTQTGTTPNTGTSTSTQPSTPHSQQTQEEYETVMITLPGGAYRFERREKNK